MVSVIVPYHNSAAWIKRCLKSLKIQSNDFEFLLVNDNSTDESEELVLQYADSRFVVLDNEHAPGVSGARNTGLDHAEGEWIAFLDSDDWFTSDASKIFEIMANYDDTANIVQANHLGQLSVGKPMLRHGNHEGVYSLIDFPRDWCMVWGKLYRASFLEGIRFKEGMQYGEDELFNLQCLDRDNRIFHIERALCPLVHWGTNKESLSHKKGAKELLLQTRVLEDFLLETDNKEIQRAICKMLSDRWRHRLMEAFG